MSRSFAVSLAVAVAVTCVANPTTSAAADGDWQYELTPYVWAAGLDGKVRINDRPSAGLAVEQDFSDILKRLDFGLMGAFEARKDRWALLLDGVYFSVSDKGGLSGPLGFTSLEGKAKVTQQLYAIGAAYRASEGARNVDVIGGLRYNSIKWDVDITASVPVLGGTRQFADTRDWVDPYVGVRIQQPVSDRWSLVGYADIGGFGLGSDFSWQAIGGANFAMTERSTLKLGYRHVDNDYQKSGFTYDMASSGFYAGVGFNW